MLIHLILSQIQLKLADYRKIIYKNNHHLKNFYYKKKTLFQNLTKT